MSYWQQNGIHKPLTENSQESWQVTVDSKCLNPSVRPLLNSEITCASIDTYTNKGRDSKRADWITKTSIFFHVRVILLSACEMKAIYKRFFFSSVWIKNWCDNPLYCLLGKRVPKFCSDSINCFVDCLRQGSWNQRWSCQFLHFKSILLLPIYLLQQCSQIEK